jgi:hypothetical protein
LYWHSPFGFDLGDRFWFLLSGQVLSTGAVVAHVNVHTKVLTGDGHSQMILALVGAKSEIALDVGSSTKGKLHLMIRL